MDVRISNFPFQNATGLRCVYAFQTYKNYHVNAHIFNEDAQEIHKYKFKQVAILDLAYMVMLGSELAVVSMLPLFFICTVW
jgi:NNP family nitrate/nitrite transporter-like MFS transporter